MSLSAPPAADRDQQLLACFQQALGHELPNHLVTIQGFARLVQMEAERLTPEARDYLTRIIDQCQRSHRLVQTLAEIGRFLRGSELPARLCLAEAFDEAVMTAKCLYPQRSIEYDGGDSLLVVNAPPATVQRALHELFSYLLRATAPAESGSVAAIHLRVRGTRLPDRSLEVSLAPEGWTLPAQAARLLGDPFSDARDPEFGLFVARLLAQGWGGGLRLDTEAEPARLVLNFPPE